MFWVDNYRFQIFLAEQNILPIYENGTTAYYKYDEAFKRARESYTFQKLFYRSHKWEN